MCGTTRKTGRFIVKRQTIRKRLSERRGTLQVLEANKKTRAFGRAYHVMVPAGGGQRPNN
jgi:hypothetical protein